jgi:hypothetical protein
MRPPGRRGGDQAGHNEQENRTESTQHRCHPTRKPGINRAATATVHTILAIRWVGAARTFAA